MKIFLILIFDSLKEQLSIYAIRGKKLFNVPNPGSFASSYELELLSEILKIEVAVGFSKLEDQIYPFPTKVTYGKPEETIILSPLISEVEVEVKIEKVNDPTFSLRMIEHNPILLGEKWFALYSSS